MYLLCVERRVDGAERRGSDKRAAILQARDVAASCVLLHCICVGASPALGALLAAEFKLRCWRGWFKAAWVRGTDQHLRKHQPPSL